MAEDENRGRDRNRDREEIDDGMIEKLIAVNRVSKTVKGGRQFTFTALTVVGDGERRSASATARRAKCRSRSRSRWKYARKGLRNVELNGPPCGTRSRPATAPRGCSCSRLPRVPA